jgi:hypothetical protein
MAVSGALDRFLDVAPLDGAGSPEQTEVLVFYSEHAIYFAIPTPWRVRTHVGRDPPVKFGRWTQSLASRIGDRSVNQGGPDFGPRSGTRTSSRRHLHRFVSQGCGSPRVCPAGSCTRPPGSAGLGQPLIRTCGPSHHRRWRCARIADPGFPGAAVFGCGWRLPVTRGPRVRLRMPRSKRRRHASARSRRSFSGGGFESRRPRQHLSVQALPHFKYEHDFRRNSRRP